ncbi:MAG: LETM1-related biofilm-associated protein [Leeuwenhoekiella sp.]
MNPSSSGWIAKHLDTLAKRYHEPVNANLMYNRMREVGFIYGISVGTICDRTPFGMSYADHERAKINLLEGLWCTYKIQHNSTEGFLEKAVGFYQKLDPEFEEFKQKKSAAPHKVLEALIHFRVLGDLGILQKNFSQLLVNALLFVDVLAFKKFLAEPAENPLPYAQQMEAIVLNVVWLALSKKEDKGEYDLKILGLFEKSIRYNKTIDHAPQELTGLGLETITNALEQYYLLDLTSLAIWDDNKIDIDEYVFVELLAKHLNYNQEDAIKIVKLTKSFIGKHREHIPYFKTGSAVKQFYDQTSKTVSLLILRNKKSLIQELRESKELLVLLAKSTQRDLSKAEKRKVKSQLLDICKSIPSLAIFILPGGGILLPILIKLIPELLPSAFNGNKIED